MTPFGLSGLGIGLAIVSKIIKRNRLTERRKKMDLVLFAARKLVERNPGIDINNYAERLYFYIIVSGLTIDQAVYKVEKRREELSMIKP